MTFGGGGGGDAGADSADSAGGGGVNWGLHPNTPPSEVYHDFFSILLHASFVSSGRGIDRPRCTTVT